MGRNGIIHSAPLLLRRLVHEKDYNFSGASRFYSSNVCIRQWIIFPGYGGWRIWIWGWNLRRNSHNGNTNAVAKADGVIFIGIGQVTTSGGTYTKTRGATGNWYLGKSAAADNSYLTVDISNLMRTVTSKGLKLTSFKVMSSVSTQALDNNYAFLSKTTYADNTAPSVSNVTLTGAQLTIAADTAASPRVQTVSVTTPAYQNTGLAKWAIDIFVNSSSQATAVYRFYGIFLYFTHDML
jgi:hypothetical protein